MRSDTFLVAVAVATLFFIVMDVVAMRRRRHAYQLAEPLLDEA